VLLYLHGLGGPMSGYFLAEIAPLFVARGWRVVAWDAPGFGASPSRERAAYGLPELASLAVGVLDALGVPDAAVLGQSWGGAVACVLAEQEPERVRSLVLLDAGHADVAALPGYSADAPCESYLQDLATFAGWDEAQAYYRDGEIRWTPELWDAVRYGLRAVSGRVEQAAAPSTLASARYGMVATSLRPAWTVLAARGTPVFLVLAGRPAERRSLNESLLPAFLAAVPQAVVDVVPEWSHDVIADGGPALAARVGGWLGSPGAPGG
jgi:pimeloyl-ACP methyl ester carboxylesterase